MSTIAKVLIICAIVTFLERAFPFIIFHGKNIPPYIEYLGKMLPMAIICTLVFYCLRNINFTSNSAYLPQIAACAATALLHLWKGNTLISIFGGTAVCMLLSNIL